jgi:hypothetical protein
MVPMAGIGPATSPLPRECSTTEPHGLLNSPNKYHVWSGRRGSNSRHSVWKTEALPTELLPHCGSSNQLSYTSSYSLLFTNNTFLVEGEGFEPSYSERTDLQSVAFNHSATPPNRTRDYAHFLTVCQT